MRQLALATALPLVLLQACTACERVAIVVDAARSDAAGLADSARVDAVGLDAPADDGEAADTADVDAPAPDASGGDAGHAEASQPDQAAADATGQDHLAVDSGAPGACGAIATFADGLAPQRELHVATAGSDGDGDGSAGLPFATLGRAAQEATPGTAIRIHPGTYAGGAYLANLQGRVDAPIWLGGAPGQARPVFAGGSEALHLVRPRYLIVHDLEVQEMTANGLNADDGGDVADALAAHHVVFANLAIHDVGGDGNQDCLKLSGLNDVWVLDSRFARCGGAMSGSGIDCVGCHRGLFARNRFEAMSGNAVQAKGGSAELEVRWNWMLQPGERGVNMGGSTGDAYFRPPLSMTTENAEARAIRVIANVFQGGTAAFAFVGCVDCLAAHNTILDPGRWVLRILQETSSHDSYSFAPAQAGRVVNNLVWFGSSALSTAVNVGAGTLPDSFEFASNLWYAHDAPAASTPDLPVVESGAVISQDPLLRDVANLDFSIPLASPAAAAGASQTGIAGDLAGRCYASPPSIGAFQAN